MELVTTMSSFPTMTNSIRTPHKSISSNGLKTPHKSIHFRTPHKSIKAGQPQDPTQVHQPKDPTQVHQNRSFGKTLISGPKCNCRLSIHTMPPQPYTLTHMHF